MSSMLDQAIIDAEALREAAIKNAEAAIVEKYSQDIREAVDQLLEQPMPMEEDPMAMPPGDPMAMPAGEIPADVEPSDFGKQVPLGALEGEELCPCPEDDDEVIEIDFTDLKKQMDAEGPEMSPEGMGTDEEMMAQMGEEEEEPLELTEAALMNIVYGDEKVKVSESTLLDILQEVVEEDLDEDIEINENDLLSLFEDDPGPDDKGEPAVKEQEELEEDENLEEATYPRYPDRQQGHNVPGDRVRLEEEDLDEELDEVLELEEENEQLQETINNLQQENKKLKNIILHAKERINEVNLSNAKLLYTNRVLTSDSLNERQKAKLVEAIAKTDSVGETKTIFETLHSAVRGASVERSPKSLNEVVSKRSSAFLPRKEDKKSRSFSNRMQILAGIK